jgi:hypothetical protein
LNKDKKMTHNEILEYIETVSGEIQLLALNIAVAAAKLAHNNTIDVEINQNLANLVNQATRAVKHMNQVIDVAKAEKGDQGILSENNVPVDQEFMTAIESSMSETIRDSERIVRLLSGVKRGRV